MTLKFVTEKYLNEYSNKFRSHSSTIRIEIITLENGVKIRGLIANRNIPKGVIIAFYPVQITNKMVDGVIDTSNNDTYTITIYRLLRNNNTKQTDFYGIPTKQTLKHIDDSLFGVPPIAMFANEPAKNEKENSGLKFPHVVQSDLIEGKEVYAFLYTTTEIMAGERISWCYGPNYFGDYDTQCND
mgnify:CR=1 FL=1